MSTASPRLAVIIASVRGGRFGPVVADWFLPHTAGFDVDVIDLAEHPLPLEMPAGGAAPGDPRTAAVLAGLSTRLERAEAYVVITPEYNHSYPASIKNMIDWTLNQWRAKPVGFVSYGGVSGGLRAVEHLRGVFAMVHAATVREQVSFTNYWELFDAEGRLREPERADAAAKTLLDQLQWWARALSEAREKRPYAA